MNTLSATLLTPPRILYVKNQTFCLLSTVIPLLSPFLRKHEISFVTQHPDQYYIEAIRRNDAKALRRLIAECYPPVEGWICQNGGEKEDAKDVFGDALEAICRKLYMGGDIELTARFSTFIFGICRNQWLKRLRRKKIDNRVRADNPEVLNAEISDPWDEALEESERMKFFRESVSALGESCRRLLELLWSEVRLPMDEVAAAMGFASANYASKRKHECIDKLKEIIRSDPRFQRIVD